MEIRFSMLRTLSDIWLTAALLVSCGCANIPRHDPVQVYVVGIEPLQGQGLELRMLVKLRVQNPNDAPIDYNGVYLTLEVEGQNLATGVSDTMGSVPRFGESVIAVPVSVSALRVFQGAMEVLRSGQTGKVAYQLKGKLSGPLFNTLRFSSKGEFSQELVDGSAPLTE
ncbi:MAG TPA: LEA type 2 family protein [Steroidobacter sp.]|nr:LEA type 2 family protein [Steroidobacter sp.]